MVKTAVSAWDAFTHVVETAPFGWWGLVGGLLGALLVPWSMRRFVLAQWAMRDWSAMQRKATEQTAGFFAGVCWTFAYWPTWQGFKTALLVGLGGPLFWAIVEWIAAKHWPGLATLLGEPKHDENAKDG